MEFQTMKTLSSKRMPRFLAALLILSILAPTLVFAQRDDFDLIPVFFFLHHRAEQPLGVLAIAPIAENVFIWAYAFTENTIPGTSHCNAATLQCIAYTYDANGNITKILENASTSAQRVVDYAYDDLNRLITASSSNVTSTANYSYTYSYNAIGNLLSGPAGTYDYAVATSSYANPHAVASITLSTTTTSYAYDNSGNLTTTSQGTSTLASYTWDYRNRMTQSTGTNATSSYVYDVLNQRIKLTENSTSTLFLTNNYNITGSSTVKSIFANGILVANINKATSTAVIRYALTDHLGGTNLVTDTSNTVLQTIDYYPYGARRINVGTDVSQREYIGQIYDEIAQLAYFNARYYNPTQGQFISQDPTFWSNKQNLQNPQSLNSYSYANDNPISLSDPTGLAATLQQQIQIIQLQINILQGILNLYNAGATDSANKALSTYQGIFSGNQSKEIKSPSDAGRGIFSGGGTLGVQNITVPLRTQMDARANDPFLKIPLAGKVYFYEKVKNKGGWDLKNTPEYDSKTYEEGFIFNGVHVDSDAPGNIQFGYVGAAANWAPETLLGGAGLAQKIAGTSLPIYQNSYFHGDDPVDQINILWGINLYYNR